MCYERRAGASRCGLEVAPTAHRRPPIGHVAAGTDMPTAGQNIVKRLNRNYVLHMIGNHKLS